MMEQLNHDDDDEDEFDLNHHDDHHNENLMMIIIMIMIMVMMWMMKNITESLRWFADIVLCATVALDDNHDHYDDD